MADNPDILNGLPNVHQRAMIRVVITGQPQTGRTPYQIDTVFTRLSIPLLGLAVDPLAEGAQRLSNMGAANVGELVGLFFPGYPNWIRNTTVPTPTPVPAPTNPPGFEGLKLGDTPLYFDPTDAPLAISEGPRPPRNISPELPIGTGQVRRSGPSTPILPRRKRRLGASGARRGSR